MELRVGLGTDCHRLAADRPLILGGVEIPHKAGLLGHSDADVLLHAVIDALLGAAGHGDIGEMFPNTDPQYRAADSATLLQQAWTRLRREGWHVINLDCTVSAEGPPLTPHKPGMAARIGELLELPAACVNVKAKTGEGVGPVGRGESISAEAIVLLQRENQQ